MCEYFECIEAWYERRKILRVRFSLRLELALLVDLGAMPGSSRNDVVSWIGTKVEAKSKL